MRPEQQPASIAPDDWEIRRQAAVQAMRAGRHWQTLTACGDEDPEIFTYADTKPGNAYSLQAAREICGRCVVKEECLTETMKLQDFNLFRAGFMIDELRALDRQNARQVRSNRQTGS